MAEDDLKLDVIAVGAHPDDVEIACGGTLAALVKQGFKVGIIDLTDGDLTADLTNEPHGAGAGATDPAVDVELRAGIVEFCQAIGNRVPAGGLPYQATGDEALAADLVASLPLLAAL